MALTYAKASCHCGLNAFQIPLLTASLPQGVDMCHCNSCRHITGQMFVHIVVMTGPPLAIDSGLAEETYQLADLSTLTVYKASEKVLRYFCPRCFTHVLYDLRQPGEKPVWAVSSGSMDRTDGLIKIGYHIFVSDTLDGGVADHLRSLDGKELPRYEGWEGSKPVPLEWRADGFVLPTSVEEQRLHAHCHCKTISLYLTRPKQRGAHMKHKFQAAHCFCKSCRLSTGSLFVTYINVPPNHIFDTHTGFPVQLLSQNDSTNAIRPNGLVRYVSSPGVFRESCGACGASIFCSYRDYDGREYLRMHMGLLDETVNGARAENWVDFDEVIHHGDDAHDKTIAEAVQVGMKLSERPSTDNSKNSGTPC